MSLADVLEEQKALLAEAIKREDGDEIAEEVVEQPAEEEVKEDPAVEEKPAEEVKIEEPAKVEEPVKTGADYARERREQKAQRDLEAANERLARLEAQNATNSQTQSDPEPNKSDDPQSWTEWKIRKSEERADQLEKALTMTVREQQVRKLRTDAEVEVEGYMQQTRQQYPDADDARQYYANIVGASLKIMNPNITNVQLNQMVRDKLMLRASELLNEGHRNPIQAMYEESKALGYKPRSKEAAVEVQAEIKPDLSKVAANRARNAGTAGANGSAERGEVTLKSASEMTNAEFAKLSVEQKRKILGGR